MILRYDLAGNKEILGVWISKSESENYWIQIFDELKTLVGEDLFFISMDGVSGFDSN